MPPEKRKAPVGPLGRPYQDMWSEENFLSNLQDEDGDGGAQVRTLFFFFCIVETTVEWRPKQVQAPGA